MKKKRKKELKKLFRILSEDLNFALLFHDMKLAHNVIREAQEKLFPGGNFLE